MIQNESFFESPMFTFTVVGYTWILGPIISTKFKVTGNRCIYKGQHAGVPKMRYLRNVTVNVLSIEPDNTVWSDCNLTVHRPTNPIKKTVRGFDTPEVQFQINFDFRGTTATQSNSKSIWVNGVEGFVRSIQ